MTIGRFGFVDQIALKISLENLQQGWANSLKESIVLKPLFAVFNSVQKVVPPDLGRIGTILQRLSFAVAVLLFGLIGLPQFASDKFGLAFVIIAGLGLWLVGRMLGGKEHRKFEVFDGIVLFYLGAHIIAAFASHYFLPSLKGLFKVFIYIGSYFLFTAVLAGSLKRKYIILSMAIGCALLLSLYGFYQYKIGVAPLATWEDPTVEGAGTRIFATLGNPNLLAGLLVPLSALSAGLGLGFLALIFKPEETARYLPRPLVIALSIGFLGAGALIAVATVLTSSRGGIGGVGVAFALILYIGSAYLWKNYRKMRPFVIAGALSVLIATPIAVLVIPSLNQRVLSVFAGSEHSSNAYRLNVWRSSFDMFKDNWWIGTGPGNETFRLAYGLYMVSSYDALGTYCVPLEEAVEAGVLGLLSFLAMVGCAMARAHLKFWDERKPLLARWLAGSLAAALVGLMIHGLVDTVFYRPQVHFLFWLILAVLVTADQPESATLD